MSDYTFINLDNNQTYNVKFASEASNYIVDAVKSLMEEKHFYIIIVFIFLQ